MTASYRNTGTKQLLLSFVQPHKPVSTTTLSRWFVTVMNESVINVTYLALILLGQCQHQSTKYKGLSLKETAKSAGWTNGKTFE